MRRGLVIGLFGIVVVACAARFARLGSVPPALYCDEAFQGYEAYCLLKTGADSRGVTAPLYFDVFGIGWEEPLYIYSTTIPVAILGTTEVAARAVAAIAGSFALAAVAWLAFEIAGARAAIAAAALMCFSPWAFHFSRVGFQASLLPLALAIGGAALLRSLRAEREEIQRAGRPAPAVARTATAWLAALALGLSIYTYVAARLVVPLLLAGLAIAAWPRLPRTPRRRLVLVAAVVVAIAAPAAIFTLTPQGQARFQEVGIASRGGGWEAVGSFVSNYLSYASPRFLLAGGDPNPRHGVGGFGVILPHEILFLLAGVAAAAARRGPREIFLLWWLAAAPIPAALSVDPRHAVRAIAATPALYALEGLGAAALLAEGGLLDLRSLRGKILGAAMGLTALIGVSGYLYRYFEIYPSASAPAWQYGLRQAYEEAEKEAARHDSIYVTRTTDFPYIHRLYLFAFPPEEYQRHRFSRTKYLFDEPVFYKGSRVPGRLEPMFVVKPGELPGGGVETRVVVPNPDGSPAFIVAW